MRELVIYISIENIHTDIDRYILTGVHGYVFNELVEKNTKKPNGFEVTNKGYYPPTSLKNLSAKIVMPEFYLDGYYISNESYYDVIFDVLRRLAYTKAKYKIDKITIKTNTIELARVIKANDSDMKELFNNFYGSKAPFLSRYVQAISPNLIRVYEGSIGLEQALKTISVGKYHKRDRFFKLNKHKLYWDPKKEKNGLIISRHVVFKNIPNERITYCFCNYKKDDPIGLQTNYVAYYQWYTKEPVPEFEQVRNMLREELEDNTVICTINSELLFDKASLQARMIYGTDYLMKRYKRDKITLIRPDGTVVASEIKPVGVAGAAQTNCDIVGSVMKDYVKGLKGEKTRLNYIDITDRFYDNGKIRKEIDTGFILRYDAESQEVMAVDKKGYKLKLVTGIDIIDRNTIKRIEKLNPSMFLAFNRLNQHMFEFYTVVHLKDTDDVIVWTNIFSNKLPYKKQ